jgi:hypothetical protein
MPHSSRQFFLSQHFLLLSASKAMAFREVKTLADFHTALTGRATRKETVYGFVLENSTKERRYCVGLECRDGRVDSYLSALQAPWRGGGQKRNVDAWSKAPSRAKQFWAQNFFYAGERVVVLRDAPVSLETAASLEVVLSGTSREHVCGGLLALDQTKAHVKDALSMLLWHDAGKCVCCGQEHFSHRCTLGSPPEMCELVKQLEEATVARAAAEESLRSARACAREACAAEPVREEPRPERLEAEEPALEEPAPAAAALVRRRIRRKRRAPEFLPAEAAPLEVVPGRRWAGFKGRLQVKCGLRLFSLLCLLRSWSKNSP